MQQTKNPEIEDRDLREKRRPIEEEVRECLKIIAISGGLSGNGKGPRDRLGDFYTEEFTDRGRKIRELPDLAPIKAVCISEPTEHRNDLLSSAAGRIAELEYLRHDLDSELRDLGLEEVEGALDGLESAAVELVAQLGQVYQNEEGGNG